MRKTILVVLALILCSCNMFASTEVILPKKGSKQPITVWNDEYRLQQEIYRLDKNQFTLISPNEVRQSDWKARKIIYYPEMTVRIDLEMVENRFFSGTVCILTESDAKVDYNLELRVDSTRQHVDLGDTPDLVLASGKIDSRGELINLPINTRNLDKPDEWVKKVNNTCYLNLQIRLISKTDHVRMFNMGVSLRFGQK